MNTLHLKHIGRIAGMLAFSLMMTVGQLAAQDDTMVVQGMRYGNDNVKTIFSNPGRLGWWVGPEFAYSQFDDKHVYFGGLSGGIIVGHSFSIGLAGMGIVNSPDLAYDGIHPTERVYLYGGYGGLKLEYRLFPKSIVNVAVPLLIGGGGAVYSTWGGNHWYGGPNDNEDYEYAWDSYFVVEPGLTVGVNILHFMRLDIGGSYRYIPDLELPGTPDDLMTGFSGTIGLRFGRF
jgi:hypothetical protein